MNFDYPELNETGVRAMRILDQELKSRFADFGKEAQELRGFAHVVDEQCGNCIHLVIQPNRHPTSDSIMCNNDQDPRLLGLGSVYSSDRDCKGFDSGSHIVMVNDIPVLSQSDATVNQLEA